MPAPTEAELEHRFTYHLPNQDQSGRMSRVRTACLDAARIISVVAPVCEESKMALHYLDLARMLANASISREETGVGIVSSTPSG